MTAVTSVLRGWLTGKAWEGGIDNHGMESQVMPSQR